MAKGALNFPPSLLRLLGPPRIECSDGVVTGPAAQRHRLALLALLAQTHQHVLAREKLIGLLWPEIPASNARKLLNVAVFEVRKAIGERVLVSEGEALRLDLRLLRVDTIDFEAALEDGRWEEAVAISSGAFLDGFALPDAVDFEQWAENERDRIERRHRHALEQLAETHLASHDYDRAVEVLRRRLARTPADGRVVQRLMAVLVQTGDRAGALALTQAHAALLRTEFDAAPDPEVTALAERLRHGGNAEGPTPVATGSALGFPPRPAASAAEQVSGAALTLGRTTGRPTERERLPRRRVFAILAATVVIGSVALLSLQGIDADPAVAGGGSASSPSPASPSRGGSLFDQPPGFVTSLQGMELVPAISPAGDRVVFAWDQGRGEMLRLFVVSSRGGDPLQLTHGEGNDAFPTWSPDGTEIAFLRTREGDPSIAPPNCCRTEVMVMPALGGSPRRLTGTSWDQGLDWSPDGRWLAFSDMPNPDAPLRIYLLDVETGVRKQFSTQPAGDVLLDTDPSFSPGADRIAFIRRAPYSGGRGSVYVQSTEEGSDAQRLTQEDWAWDVAWTADQSALILATGDPSGHYLLRVPLNGDKPVPLPVGSGARSLSISPTTGALVYAEQFQDHDIWKIPGPAAQTTSTPARLISSTRDDFMPEFSVDGERLAFVSARTGRWEVWVSDADGANQQRLTEIGYAIFPRWSPDGRRIAFSSMAGDTLGVRSDVYVMHVDRRLPENFTSDEHQDGIPSWSPDGRWLYFQSRQDTLGWQLWRKPAEGGQEEQVLSSPILRPRFTDDGRLVYYVPGKSVWLLDGDTPVQLHPGVSFWTEWTIWRNTLVLVHHSDSTSTIEMVDIATRETRRLATVPTELKRALRLPGNSLAVSPDGSWIAYTALQGHGSDLRIVR